MLLSHQLWRASKNITVFSCNILARASRIRLFFYGDNTMLTEIEKERFWAKVDKTGDCWLWTAGKNEKGYGSFNRLKGIKGTRKAHRISWMMAHGEIENSLQINHHCDVPSCVNPDHLYKGTASQNTDDMVKRDRTGKLNKEQIQEILSLQYYKTQQEIADVFKVHPSNISLILRGKTWKHLTNPKEIK